MTSDSATVVDVEDVDVDVELDVEVDEVEVDVLDDEVGGGASVEVVTTDVA